MSDILIFYALFLYKIEDYLIKAHLIS